MPERTIVDLKSTNAQDLPAPALYISILYLLCIQILKVHNSL